MDQKERLTGSFEHLLAFAFFIFPLGNIIGPLVLWLVKRQGSMFIDEHGKASLNFQISMTLYGILAAILSLAGVGLLILPVIIVADGVLVIVAAVQAHRGDLFHYPVTIRFIH
ncbi:MAG TPA: DUF4870 domain-containing protein [Actinomycetota bacterium]|nr:DUF4870 domain-containing protein [Actinomycetota bacterium]